MARKVYDNRAIYVVARNMHGRPTLQHRLFPGTTDETACGADIRSWSRAYQNQPIEAILCRRNACRAPQS
jgi:hypothetical protein